MEQKFNEIIQKARNVRLRPEERAEIRARLYAATGEVKSEKLKVKSFGWQFFRPVPIFASLMIALLVGGGVSFASENALPGDLLYPVKVGINEEIRSKIALSTERKADWDVRRAERRLEEAEKLSEQGRLNAENKAVVEAKFEQHAAKAGERAQKAEAVVTAKAKAKSLIKLETVLQKHGRILTRLAEEDPARAEISMMAVADAELSAKAIIRESDDRESRAVQDKIAEVSKFFSGKSSINEERIPSPPVRRAIIR